ncbi:MAG: PRC-barrel domain-containing protein [Parcubacteria group bacterium]
MLIDFKKLKRLPVQTENGELLGNTDDLLIDTDTKQIAKFQVEERKLMRNGAQFLVSPDQIINIGVERIIVSNGVSRQSATQANKPLLSLNAAALNAERE